jgi:hypothetical protein
MIAHSVSKRSAKSLPQVESTVSLSITAKLMKFVARQDFVVGNCHVKAGETCFAVRSERREGRYYIVRFNAERATYQCSCGANCSEHAHLKVVREYVMSHVVAPAKSDAPAMTVPATVAQVKAARKAKAEMPQNRTEKAGNGLVLDVTTQSTVEQWKAIKRADRKRQQAWQDEYRQQVQALREEVAG